MATEACPCPLCGTREGRAAWESADATATTCDDCGMVYLSRLTDPARAVARATYEGIYARPAIRSNLTRRSYATVLERFERFRRTGRIVDIGCGAGGFLAVAARSGWEAIGTETAPGAGALAREGARILIGEEASREIPDASVDVVTLWEVIEHVGDPLGILREARRLLRPGGLLYLTTPNHASLQRRLLGRRWPRFHLEHLAYFDTRTMGLALEQSGLRTLRIHTKNFDPFLIAATLLGRSSDGFADEDPVEDLAAARPAWSESGRDALRAFIKGNPVGSRLATAVNGVLARYGLGDTLVAEAERR